jgi:hypothetical protein
MKTQEKELRDIGRDRIRVKWKLKPDVNAPNYQTPGARMWLYGYDGIGEVGDSIADLILILANEESYTCSDILEGR